MNEGVGEGKSDAPAGWKEFIGQPGELRLLQLAWIATNRSELGFLWFMVERTIFKGVTGPGSKKDLSSKYIETRVRPLFGDAANRTGIGMVIRDGLLSGLIAAMPGGGKAARELWLEWSALYARLQAAVMPTVDVLKLNWIAANKAELAVLWELSKLYQEQGQEAFTGLSSRALAALYEGVLGVNHMTVARAFQSLSVAGLIETTTKGRNVVRQMRIVQAKVDCHPLLESLHTIPQADVW